MFKIGSDRRNRDQQELQNSPGAFGPTNSRLQAGARKGDSIRWKLAGAFIAMACFVAAFIGVAIAI